MIQVHVSGQQQQQQEKWLASADLFIIAVQVTDAPHTRDDAIRSPFIILALTLAMQIRRLIFY